MTFQEIIATSGGALFVLLTILQIAPIKINPWSWIARCVGRAINKEMMDKIDKTSQKVDILEQRFDERIDVLEHKFDERDATNCRSQILRFGDEILHGVPHSKEHYDQILLDITTYENYCGDHHEYMNNVAVATISNIKKMYQKHLENNDFL